MTWQSWSRGAAAISAATARYISPYTVNDTTEQLKKLFTRAKTWGVRFDHEPAWRDHWLDEPQERVRELQDAESDRLDAEMRERSGAVLCLR